MNRQKLFLTSVLALALGFGIWTIAAVSFQTVTSDFQEGEVVSASEFNDLFERIDDNFTAAANAIDGKVDETGDTMSGRLGISTDSGPFAGDGSNAALYAQNTNPNGVSAFFEGDTTEPVLVVRNNGSGPLLRATNGSGNGFEVANDGTLQLGTLTNPEIVIDPTTGTIGGDLTLQDNVTIEGDLTVDGSIQNGDGTAFGPVAFASWDASASTAGQNSSNITSITRNAAQERYEIAFDSSVSISDFPVVSVSVRNAGQGESITYDVSSSNQIDVYVWETPGAATDTSDWSFVLHQP